MEVNTSKGVYHCWACGYKGKLLRLFKDYASDRQWSALRALPIYREGTDELQLGKIRGPKVKDQARETLGSYKSLTSHWPGSIHYYAALGYLEERGITPAVIKKWDIAFADTGPNKYRVIIPSRSETGELEYYVARGFYDYVTPKYRNPSIPKQEIIFGETYVDWRRPVVLTEGAFDSIIALNAVPILGTEIRTHTKLLKKIRANNTPVVICLDTEAWQKAKEAYKLLDDLGVDVKIVRIPETYGDLSKAFEVAGPKAVLEILDSAHRMSWEESLW
jgi:DNA primase